MTPSMPSAADPILRIIPAVLTPMRADLSPDFEALLRHARWLLATGADGLGILGTTGEANSFSVRERLAILDALAAGGIPGSTVIAGTGCCAIPDTVELSKKAIEIGAAGVLWLPPFYYKNVKDDGVFDSYATSIDRIGDARLRVYLYHFPQQSALPLSVDLVGRLIEHFPGIVVGLKDSAGDFAYTETLVRRFPGFRVYPGSEHHLYNGLKAGAAGTISASCNVTSPLAAEVLAAWRAGRDASALQQRLSAIRGTIQSMPLIAALKAIIARHTGDKRWTNIRPPNIALGDSEAKTLFEKVDAAELKLAAAI
ncbi:MAG: dihydrodipicolinate synthase family protein [Alphaproteobacteria bacterium]|nr:dihydrodipicolinate synthase family protein [Alphaproteobacteria bacterium]